jgi:putative MATE family efflux protein
VGIYTSDAEIIRMGAAYLRLVAVGYLPQLCTILISAILRNTGHAKLPMIASIISVITNTLLNYILIFGKLGAPKFGVYCTAIATTTARILECLVLLVFFLKLQKGNAFRIHFNCSIPRSFMKQTLAIAAPIVLNEFLWGFGDTMYGIIFGHMAKYELAAIVLTYPVQNLSIGLFTGISAAVAIMTGNNLGKNETNQAYLISYNLVKLGMIGSAGFACVMILLARIYAGLFKVPAATGKTTVLLLYVFAAFFLIKVTNMILSGGVLRSGGNTKYSLVLDVLGTLGIGLPLGFITAFVFNWSIVWVYFSITLEEVVRFILGFRIYKSRKWMNNITVDQ